MGGVNPSTALATVVVDELLAGGITDAVLCPGSRNAPLSMALHAADAAGRLRLHVRIDERTAGFLALGLARGSSRPVPVATTSGTAVANLHPAVLEAHHSGVPLLVLSADRPPRLRGVGANQVIDQMTVFDSGVLRFQREFAVPARVSGQNALWRSQVCRALAAAAGSGLPPGPVQLNIPLDMPLMPDAPEPGDVPREDGGTADWPEPLVGRSGAWTAMTSATGPGPAIDAPRPGERCLFIADLTHPLAAEVAAAGHLVISEAGGLGGTGVLAAGIHLLADRDFLDVHRPDRVIVLGRPTLFRPVTELLTGEDITIDVVDHPARYADLAGYARSVAPALAPLTADADDHWRAQWQDADRRAAAAADAVLTERGGSAAMVRAVADSIPGGSTLVLGSSQVPRDLGRFARPRPGVRVIANRGVAGIDGTVSTAVGVALASPAAPVVALMGDLTFLHDITGLAIGPGEPRPDLTIVVVNNNGGGIFATLEPGEPQHAAAFERVFATPVEADLRALVEGLGARYARAATAKEVTAALAAGPVAAGPGITVIEVPVGRADLRELLADVRDAVHTALTGTPQ